MTDRQLHDLLDDLVAGTAPVDLVDVAWDRARRVRRRRVAGAAGATAAVLVAGGALALVDRRGGGDGPEQPVVTPSVAAPTSPAPAPAPRTPPDSTYSGTGIWWSPAADEEAELPWVTTSPLPREIRLDAAEPVAGLERALAVFAFFDNAEAAPAPPTRIVVLAPDGSPHLLDHSRLSPVRDEPGNHGPVVPALSPGGRHVLFAQNSSIEVYEFATRTWRTIDTPDWLAEGARWLDDVTIWVPDDLISRRGSTYGVDGRRGESVAVDPELPLGTGEPYPYGPAPAFRGGVASSYSSLQGPVPGPPGAVSNPQAVVVREGGRVSALTFVDDAATAAGRSKGCCPTVGWLDPQTVVYASQGRLLAWSVGSHDVRRVAELSGTTVTEGYVASWALTGE